MALVLANRVQEQATANTTVSFTLTGAILGFQTFAVVGNGNTTYYSATDLSGNWEVGLGTYSTTGPTLTRTTVYASSNSGSAVTFSGTVTVFVTYPSGRSVNLDASGNVGIGTTTPGAKLDVVDSSSNDALRITQTGAGNAFLVEDSSPDSTPFVIDANGRTAIGSTTALTYSSSSSITPNLQVNAAGAATSGISRFSTNSSANAYWFLKSRGATTGAFDVVASGDTLGTIGWLGADGTDGIQAATIAAAVDGTPGQTAGTFTVGLSYRILSIGTTDFTLIGAASNTVGITFTATGAGTGTGTAILTTGDMPGRLVFSTTPDGSASPTERMRLDKIGQQTQFGPLVVSNTLANNVIYDSKSFDASTQEAGVTGIAFRPDGKMMYILGTGGDDITYYSLSTAWDISTATFVSQSNSTTAQNATPQGFCFKPDGTKVFIVGGTAPAGVWSYSCTSPWDVSTITYDSKTVDISAFTTGPSGIWFKPDGTKMYISSNTGATSTYTDTVLEYTLSTAWDVSSASLTTYFSVAAQDTGPAGVQFTNDGMRMFVAGQVGDNVVVYDLSTAWDLSTASFAVETSNLQTLVGATITITDLYVEPNGQKLYIISDTGSAAGSNMVYQFTALQPATVNLTGDTTISGNTTVAQDLTVYGSAVFSNGSAGTPSLAGSDANTGIFFPAADTVAVSTGGTERVRVDSSGNVGIGLTPTASVGALQVSGSVFATATQYVGAAGSTAFSGGIQNLSNTSKSISIEADPTNVGASSLIYFNIDGSTKMAIDSSGNVGIGTSSPAASLSVAKQTTALSGTGNSYGLYMYPTSSGLTYIDAITGSTANTSLGFRTYNNGTYNEVRIDSSGNTLIGGTAARGTTVGTAHLDLFNGTAPAGTLTNGISLYSSSGDFNFMDSAGNGYKVGFRNLPPVGTKTGSYTLAVGDVGKYVQVSTGGSITIPTSTFAEGDAISIANNTTGNITITCSAPTAYIAGTNTVKTSMTLATRGVATVLFISSTVCFVSGNVT